MPHILVGRQPNQTGPLNTAGLGGEGNDLGSTTTPWKQKPTTDRQTDGRTRAREENPPHSRFSLPFAPTQKESQTLAMQTLAHPYTHSSVCGTPPPATGGPKATSYGSSTLVCSRQLHALFLPSASSSLSASSSTYSDLLSLSCSLDSPPQGFLGKQHLRHLPPSKGPLGPVSALHVGLTLQPHSL